MKLARRDYVASLKSGLAVIEAFDAGHPSLTLSEVASRTDLTRAAARRYLLTLTQLGYADYDGKHFSLDLRVLRLGYGLLASAPLPRKAQPVLDTVGWQTDEMASIAVLDEMAAVFLARSQSRRIFSPVVAIGSRLPAYCSSAGRVLLAQRSDGELRLMLGHTNMVRFTPNTCATPEAVLAAVQAVRTWGYSLSDEEYELGLRSIAVPVPNLHGSVEVAMVVSMPASRMSAAGMVETVLPVLQAGARTLSALL